MCKSANIKTVISSNSVSDINFQCFQLTFLHIASFNVNICIFYLSESCSVDAHFLTMATEDKKPETDTKPPVVPSASASQSKVLTFCLVGSFMFTVGKK